MNFYAYQKLLGKINDSEDLRNEFIKIFDEKTKAELVRFGILLGEHLLEITSFEKCIKVQEIFKALENWLSGKKQLP